MKNFVLLKFAETVTPDHIIDSITSPSLKFKDFSSPTDSVAYGFSDITKEIPYVYDSGNKLLSVEWKVRKKSIPASVIKERLLEEKERIFNLYQTKMSKKEERDFKEQLIEELMPHAYPKTTITQFYFDFNTHVIYAGVSNTDNVIEILMNLNRELSDKHDGLTLELEAMTKDYPFASTMKNLLLNKYFSSEENNESEYKLIPTGSYVIVGESQVGDLNNSKIALKNISSESEDLFQALDGSTTRLVSSIGLVNEDASFVVNETLNFTSVQFDQAMPKFNAEEMSMEEYLKGNLLISINTMAHIFNCVSNLLETGHKKYANQE